MSWSSVGGGGRSCGGDGGTNIQRTHVSFVFYLFFVQNLVVSNTSFEAYQVYHKVLFLLLKFLSSLKQQKLIRPCGTRNLAPWPVVHSTLMMSCRYLQRRQRTAANTTMSLCILRAERVNNIKKNIFILYFFVHSAFTIIFLFLHFHFHFLF